VIGDGVNPFDALERFESQDQLSNEFDYALTENAGKLRRSSRKRKSYLEIEPCGCVEVGINLIGLAHCTNSLVNENLALHFAL
jgi:hypothetical protein